MTYDKTITPLGGYGLDIKLHHASNTPAVFWVNGNSYAIAPVTEGVMNARTGAYGRAFKTPDGDLVDLYSINGIGEVRWSVDPWLMRREEKEAAAYFELEPLPEKTIHDG